MKKNKLLEVRLKKGLSQEELADLINMTQSSYCRREKGLKKITDIEWLKIAKILGVEKEDIFESDTANDKSVSRKTILSHSFILPDFVLDHIETLKSQNKELIQENKILKGKLKN